MAFSKLFLGIDTFITRIYLYVRYDSWTIVEYYRKQGAHIGNDCRIDVRIKWSDAYLISLGNHVFIAQGAMLHTHDGGAWVLRDEIPNLRITGKITIGDNCVIGAYSHIFPNVSIGNNSIVGTASVVISDVPPNSIVMGVPARVIGSTIKYKEKHLHAWKELMVMGSQKSPDPKKSERYYPL